jgi:hypothetical protein
MRQPASTPLPRAATFVFRKRGTDEPGIASSATWLNHNATGVRGDVTPEDLPADRVLAQAAALTRIYLGRLQRLEWDRHSVRDLVTSLGRPRIYTVRQLERQPGGRALDLAAGTPGESD